MHICCFYLSRISRRVPNKQQKNFIKENIQRVKSCNQCFRNKVTSKLNPVQQENVNICAKKSDSKHDHRQLPNLTCDVKTRPPVVKCNVKVRIPPLEGKTKGISLKGRTDSRELCAVANVKDGCKKNYKNQECQTDIYGDHDSLLLATSCSVCGNHIDRVDVGLQATVNSDTIEMDDETAITTTNKNKTLSATNNTDKQMYQMQTSNIDKKCTKHTLKENLCSKQENGCKLVTNHKIGVVPRYLKERNAKYEQEKMEAKEREKLEEMLGFKDPDCPLGHMLMPNTERIELLNQLQIEFDEQIKILNRMPVSSDSFRIRQRKMEIEKELNRIEEAINALNKAKVFIKINNCNNTT